jgi:hypothetical protein
MTDWLRQIFIFVRFTLREYVRSGRILIEILAAIIVAWTFFWPNGAVKGLDPFWFFSMAGVFFLFLPAYTTIAITRLGNRPQGYIVFSRNLGRHGYLIGLYITVGVVMLIIYLLFNLIVQLVWSTRPHTLTVGGWVLGTIPLLLNSAIISAFCTLITPLVLPSKTRLLIMGLVVLASGVNILASIHLFGDALLRPVQAILDLPLLPALRGFELAARRDYSIAALVVLLGQGLLALALMSCALLAFTRRELILKS